MSVTRIVLVVSLAAIFLGAVTAVLLSEFESDLEIVTAQAQTATDPNSPQPAQFVVPERRYLQIDWPAARAASARTQRPERDTLLRAAKRQANMADRLSLPLLLPGDKAISDNLKLYTTHTDQYAASSKQEGAIVELIGSRIATVVPPGAAPELPALRSAARASYRIERTEYGLDISFTRFGAAYNISILCDDPYKDERCTKDDYAISLVESAKVLIPEPEAPPQ
jgi:hypothetical protein